MSSKRRRGGQCSKSDLEMHLFILHLPVPLSVQSHSQIGARPPSFFIHPGMWDVLTGWLSIESAQLRVLPAPPRGSPSQSVLCVSKRVSTPLSVLSADQASHR